MDNKIVHEVDVMGLFNALYANGRTKLSDHFVNDDPGNGETENKTDK